MDKFIFGFNLFASGLNVGIFMHQPHGFGWLNFALAVCNFGAAMLYRNRLVCA